MVTSLLSMVMDYRLSPLVKKIPSYVKDTNNFLSKLHEIHVTSESLLVPTLLLTKFCQRESFMVLIDEGGIARAEL